MAYVASKVEVKALDLSPAEAAEIFTEFSGEQMAEFFSEVWKIAREWNGAGWCGQSYAIAQASDNDCRSAVKTLAAHFEEQDA